MKFQFKLILAVLFLSFTSHSQSLPVSAEPANVKRRCGTEMPPAEWDAWFNTKVQEFNESKALGKTQITSVTIPVVVHVIHGGQTVGLFPNISLAQIKSQIAVLNKDYAGMGLNVNKLATTGFSDVGAANCMITFCLAQYDPNGNPLTEPGVDRLNYNLKGWTNPASASSNAALMSLMDNTIKPASIWDPTTYFNIWVSDENNSVSILGYATFPNGSGLSGMSGNLGNSVSDGIWVWGRCFGNTGTLISPYNQGRTATHETGHWLGLRHIGGDSFNSVGDCNATDYCNDTPAQKGGFGGGTNGQNFGNPAYPLHANTCSSSFGDMFMNFMDYTDDAAMYMFTPDQNSRIQTAMLNGFFRNQLGASSTTLCSGTPYADILLDSILCVNADINGLNQSSGDAPLSYTWVATPSVGVTFSPNNTNANPSIKFANTGMYTLTTLVSNTVGVSISTLSVRLEVCDGINENAGFLNTVSVFPNPSNGKINIQCKTDNRNVIQVQIYNTLGQRIMSSQFSGSTGEIQLNSPTDGVYSLVLSSGSFTITKRILIKN